MSKEDIISSIVYVVMLAFAIIVGVIVVQPIISSGYLGKDGSLFGFLFLSLLIGLVLNALIIEIGHLIGAKIGKYEILTFNVLAFSFYKKKEEHGIKFKFKFPRNYDGLTGETIIAPKSEKSKPMSYVFLPIVLFGLEIVGCIFAFLSIKDGPNNFMMMYIKYGVFISTCIGGMIIIYDYFPARLDNMNDGYRLVLLNKKININAFNELLRVQKCEFYSEDSGEIKQFEQITDFTAKVNMLSANRLALNEYQESLKIIDNLLSAKDKISNNTYFDIKLTKCFILFMNDQIEEAKNYYINEFSDDEKKFIVNCTRIDTCRVYLLYEGLIEKSNSEVELALEKSQKALKKVLPGLKDKEEKLLNLVKEKIS